MNERTGIDTARKVPRTPAQLAEVVQQVRERNGKAAQAQAGPPMDFTKQLAYLGGIPREAVALIERRFAELETRVAILEAGQKPGPVTDFDRAEKRKH